MRFSSRLVLALLLVVAAAGVHAAQTQSSREAEAALKAAQHREEIEGDLPGAIEDYKQLSQNADKAIAAQAQLRLAGCYQKLGDAQATKIYQQLASSTDAMVATEARRRLAALQPKPATSPMPFRPIWTAYPGDDPVRVSPDGRYLAIIDGNDDLKIREIATSVVLKAANVQDIGTSAEEPAFSRDSKHVAYSWTNAGGQVGDLRVVTIQNGALTPPQVLLHRDDIWWAEPYDWTPDGKGIVVSVARKAGGPYEIGFVSVDSREYRTLKILDSPDGANLMALSPDGNYLAFDMQDRVTRMHDVFVMNMRTAETARIVENKANDLFVGWSRDGREVFFTSDRSGTKALFSQPVESGVRIGPLREVRGDMSDYKPMGITDAGVLYGAKDTSNGPSVEVRVAAFDFTAGQLTSPATDVVKEYLLGTSQLPAWSPDGKFLAYVRSNQRPAPLIRNATIVIRAAGTNQLIREIRPALNHVVSCTWFPDGQSFAVGGMSLDNKNGLWRVNAATGETTPLFEGPLNVKPQSWSADGSKIVYVRPAPPRAFVEQDLASGTVREILAWPDAMGGSMPALSPDLRTAYYRGGTAGRRGAPPPTSTPLIGRNIATGTERVITLTSLAGLVLSPDGKYIAGGTPQSDAVLLVDVANGTTRDLIRIPDAEKGRYRLGVVIWARDSASMIVTKVLGTGPQRLPEAEYWWVPLSASKAPLRIPLADDGASLNDFQISPDGRFIAFQAWSGATGPAKPKEVWVLENLSRR